MSYSAAIDHLHSLAQELAPAAQGAERRKFDLSHMRALANALGNPQQSFRSVLIAGTNGKGSTAATLSNILGAAGYRTGLYTSPHLMRVNERIQTTVPATPTEYSSAEVPGSAGSARLVPISDEEFARLFFVVHDAATRLVDRAMVPHMPSFFEIVTAMCFCYFKERGIEIAILEVGLGGRLDATNIVDPLLSIITDISLDHQDYLGSTLKQIAREKAGIMRSHGTLITLPQHPEVNQALGEVAANLEGLKALSATEFLPGPGETKARPGRSWRANSRFPPLRTNLYEIEADGVALQIASPLPGQHQQRNVALAITAALELRNTHGYIISKDAIEEGIRDVRWPGRLQQIEVSKDRQVLLDAAHNPAGAWSLRAALSQVPENRPRTLIFSCLRDKNLDEIAQILFPLFDPSSADPNRAADHIVVMRLATPRAIGVEELTRAAERLHVDVDATPDVPAAFQRALDLTPEGGLIVIAGSVYLVGEALSLIESTA